MAVTTAGFGSAGFGGGDPQADAATSTAPVALTGAGSLTVTGLDTGPAAAALTGAGALSVTGSGTVPGTASLDGAGTLNVGQSQTQAGTLTLAGAGAMTAGAALTRAGPAALAGVGTLTAGGASTVNATATLTGAGTLGVTGTNAAATWVLVSSDEFAAIDPTKWQVYDGSTFGAPTRIQTYQAANATAGAGSVGATGGTSLKLRTLETDAGSGTLPTTSSAGTRYSYTAGMLDSQSVSRYYPRFCRIEWRAKLPHGQGLWPAFWLTAKNGGATTCEFDIVEYFHSQLPGKNSSTIHGTDNTGTYSQNRYTNNGAAGNGTGGRTFFEAPTYTPGWHTWAAEIVPVTDATGATLADPTVPSSYVRFTVYLDGAQVWQVVDTSALWWTTNGGDQDSFWNVYLQGCQVDGNYVGHPRDSLAYSHWLDQCLISGTPGSCTTATGGFSVQRAQFTDPASTVEIDYQQVWKLTTTGAPSFASGPAQTAVFNGFGTSVASGALTPTAAGSLIVVEVTNQLASGNGVSVTDNVGNTYTLGVASAGVSQRHEEIWYCLSAAAGVTAVTVNNGATSANVAGTVTEWLGGASSATGVNSLNNASSATPPAATVTAAAGYLVIGNLGYIAATASTRQDTLSAAGYTSLTPVTRGTNTMHASAWLAPTGAGATGPTWAMNPGVSTGEATIAFAPVTAPTTVTGAASLTGSGTLTVTGQGTQTGPVTLAGAGVLTVAGTQTGSGATPFTGTGTLTVTTAAAPLTPVQQVAGSAAAATGSTVTIPATQAGNFVRIMVARSGGLSTGALTGVTDSAGGTWTLGPRGAVSGVSNTRIEYWYRNNCPSITSITLTSGTSQTFAWNVTEWPGSYTVDAASPDNSATTSTTTATTPTVATANANDLIEAGWHFGQTTTSGLSTGWTALTSFDDTTVGSGRAAYMQVAATGSYQASLTLTAAKAAGVLTVALVAPVTATPQTGTVALTGVGALTVTGTGTANPGVALAGSGVLTAAGGQTEPGTVLLTGTGAVTVGVVVNRTGAVALVGAGAVTVTGSDIAPAAVAVTGAGVLSVSGAGTEPAPVALTGVGVLTVTAGSGSVTGTVILTGGGSVTVGQTQTVPAAVLLTGAGTVTVTGVRSQPAAVAFTGAGALSVTGADTAPGAVTLSGAGAVTVGVAGSATGTIPMTGSGLVTVGQSQTTPATLPLPGVGVLTVTQGQTEPGSAQLTGVSVLTVTTTQTVVGTVGFTGAGMLGVTATGGVPGPVTLTGIGTVTVTGAGTGPGVVVLAGAGVFTGAGTQTGSGSVPLPGVGVLVVTAISGTVAAVTLTGVGGLSITGQGTQPGGVNLNGTGVLGVTGAGTEQAPTITAGTGTLTVTAALTTLATLTLVGAGSLTVAGAGGEQSGTTLTGAAGLQLVALVTEAAAVTLAGAGGLTLTGLGALTAALALGGAGALGATATGGTSGPAALTGHGTLTVAGSVAGATAVTLTGAGALTLTGVGSMVAALTLTGRAVLAVGAQQTYHGRWSVWGGTTEHTLLLDREVEPGTLPQIRFDQIWRG